MEEKPSYFAIITADVRYDNNLCANEKLMFGEITALLQKTGVCWASNRYFAELFNVSKETVSRWINHLFELNYICVQVIRDVSTNQIIERTITLPTTHCGTSIPIDKNINTPIDKKINTPIEKNVKENNINNINNTSKNNTSNIIQVKHKYGEYSNVLLTDKEYNKLKEEYSENIYPSYLDLIKYLDEYIEMKGYKAKSHYLAIKKWVVSAIHRDIEEKNRFKQPKRDNTMDILKDLYQKYSEEEQAGDN